VFLGNFLAISSIGGGGFWHFFCDSFPLGGCFLWLWLLLVVSLVMVVVAGRWCGGGKVGF